MLVTGLPVESTASRSGRAARRGGRTSVRCAACGGPATSWTRSPAAASAPGSGVVLTPVPTAALAGVDVTIAVNLLGRQALPAWPDAPEPERAARDRDPVVESLELASFSAAAAQTAAASVPVTPRFGPGTWRDFRHADRFLAAGEEAMEQALSGLRALARPGRQ